MPLLHSVFVPILSRRQLTGSIRREAVAPSPEAYQANRDVVQRCHDLRQLTFTHLRLIFSKGGWIVLPFDAARIGTKVDFASDKRPLLKRHCLTSNDALAMTNDVCAIAPEISPLLWPLSLGW